MQYTTLLAQRDNWERLGDRFSGRQAEIDSTELMVIGLAVVGAAALLWALHRLAKWQETRVRQPNSKKLFNELCRTHRLSGWEKKALRSLAEYVDAKQPADVFLQPEAFAAEAMAAVTPDEPTALEPLKQKLFSNDSDE